jgi:hypothetical protein
MKKTINKIGYALVDTAGVAKNVLRDGWEGVCYLLWLVNPPTMSKAMFGPQMRELYSYKSLYQRMDGLYEKGYIGRIGRHKKFSFFFKKGFRYNFLDDYLALKIEKFYKPWDRKWRLLIYDIPQKNSPKREQFRRHIKNLGFGMSQKSCWVNAYDFTYPIDEFCRQNKMSDCICSYEGAFLTGENIDTMVERVWKISDFFSVYETIISMADGYLRAIKTQQISFKDYYVKYCELFAQYKNALLRDPFLPKEFTPLWQKRDLAENRLSILLRALFKECGMSL